MKRFKVLTVVGARPQFIKAGPVSKAFEQVGLDEILVHTGQHYDFNMSDVFFQDMNLRVPDFNLDTRSGTHAEQTAQMLIGIERLIEEHKPDCVVVYGDTNSTLAGALAAIKLHIPVAHIEAGLRSFNRMMPEEHNRVLTDHSADILFCPTQTAVEHLKREGINKNVHLVGDTMYDALLESIPVAQQHSQILARLDITPKRFLLVTVHRPYNTDIPDNLNAIISVLNDCNETVVFPVHPRTRSRLSNFSISPKVKLIDPVGYLDMIWLESNAKKIATDSGGVQKEAYFLKVPCITLRPETEWIETLNDGWNKIVGVNQEQILAALTSPPPQSEPLPVFGDGHAATRIAAILQDWLRSELCDYHEK